MAGPEITRSPLIAVDTNFIIDLHEKEEDCLAAWEVLNERTITPTFVAPPTVVQEIAFLAKTAANAADRERYRDAASEALRVYGIRPVDLIAVGHGITERCTNEFRSSPDLIPPDEVNDSLILAETCLIRCSILITSDSHLNANDMQKAAEILEGYGSVPLIIWPRKILKVFR